MRALGALLVIAVAGAVPAGPAHAGVVVGDGVPFSARELERALAARTPAAAALALDVRASGPGRLVVVGAGAQWHVEIGGARGSLAARLVALNVLDSGRVELPVEPAATPAPVRAPRRLTVTVHGGARRGTAAHDLTATVTGAELDVDVRARVWLGGALELHEDLARAPAGAATVDGGAALVRVLAGVRLGALDLGAGPLAGRVHVDHGDERSRGWQLGVAAVARAQLPLSARWALVAALGVDGYRHRIEVRDDGDTLAATPRAAVTATVGVRWQSGRAR